MLRRSFAVFLLLGAAAAGQDQPTATEKSPLVRPLRGDLSAWRSVSGKIESFAKESPVLPSDRLGTLDGGYAVLLTEGNMIISLKGVKVGRQKGLALERVGKKLVVRLYEGKLILDSFETDILVRTPHGEVEGSKVYFLIESTGKSTAVVAIHGGLTLTNSLGSVKIEPGHKSEVAGDKAPTNPERADVGRETLEISAVESAQNLLRNPGFEADLSHWQCRTVDKFEVTAVETRLCHTGAKCARTEASNRIFANDRPDWLPFWQEVTLKPGRRYLARAFLRTETAEGLVIPRLQLETNNDGGADYSEFRCEKTWKMARVIFTAKDSLYRIHVRSTVKTDQFDCMIYADDFFLTELPEPNARSR